MFHQVSYAVPCIELHPNSLWHIPPLTIFTDFIKVFWYGDIFIPCSDLGNFYQFLFLFSLCVVIACCKMFLTFSTVIIPSGGVTLGHKMSFAEEYFNYILLFFSYHKYSGQIPICLTVLLASEATFKRL